ncbi:hypothetical protein SNE40_009399 [Patella caerulea]|uniref:PLD phosphodiesterase domain-containing protein n=1 Tax=Patella caerulea TaxID=87958 RepID=A0AAN8PQ77_PATCE
MNVQQEKTTLLGTQSVEFSGRHKCLCSRTVKLCIIPLILIAVAIGCGLSLSYYLPHSQPTPVHSHNCTDFCTLTLTETIPQNLTFRKNETIHVPTGQSLLDLINIAKHTIEIASYYWTLRGIDLSYHDDTSKEGERLFDALMNAGQNRNIILKIVQNIPSKDYTDNDTALLASQGNAEVRSMNFTRLIGSGIIHTKMWLIDRKHFYVGSANLDWRSLTQVKELGVIVRNCSCLATDMGKIFDVYWNLSEQNAEIPKSWEPQLSTVINEANPEVVQYNNTKGTIYLSSSPPELCPPGRTSDIDSILSVIKDARYFVSVAVMDYFPTTLYSYPRKYWAIIDDALRDAAFNRHVRVRVLASYWNHTAPDMLYFLRSLQSINMHIPLWERNKTLHVDVEVKIFEVPAYTESQRKIPYVRVNHNKYMVTDKHAYIGTSNWSGDYFISTGGIGFILNQTNVNKTSDNLRLQLHNLFERDWYSNYSQPINKYFSV